ncbi:MAG TPA: hypothetical protein VEZ11_03765 [Thermoanaerobaculia bacterium]|nr:hypothetical protein [Thermoanaerobaculia bacterium]
MSSRSSSFVALQKGMVFHDTHNDGLVTRGITIERSVQQRYRAPSFPTSNDTITIRVESSFEADGHVTSASIQQVGNTFVIEQNVEVVCGPITPPPSFPLIVSQFQVGPLTPGAYNVTAHINVTPCFVPFTQTAAFAVTPPLNTPTLDRPGLLLLGAALAVSALMILSERR